MTTVLHVILVKLWQANVDKNLYFLIFEIHFQIFEIHIVILEIYFLIFEIHFLISKIHFLIFKIRTIFQIFKNKFWILENEFQILDWGIPKFASAWKFLSSPNARMARNVQKQYGHGVKLQCINKIISNIKTKNNNGFIGENIEN